MDEDTEPQYPGPWHARKHYISTAELVAANGEWIAEAVCSDKLADLLAAAWLLPELIDAVSQIAHARVLEDDNELANGIESARRVYEKICEHGYEDLSA